MNERERMLRELNLHPVWVRRDALAESTEIAQPVATPEAGQASVDLAANEPGVRGSDVPARADEAARAAIVRGDEAAERPNASEAAQGSDSHYGAAQFQSPADDARAGAVTAREGAVARMSWPELKEAVRACTACPLHAQRNQSVFGVGDEAADWLFVGEGPGAEEDARGEPFVGQAGRLLDNMLAAIGLSRGQDVYIANVVKCRPPGNRTPQPVEARCCEPYLERQIALLRPRLIVALGKTAAENLLRREASIASLRGRVHDYNGIGMIVTYHPAYLLRTLADKAKAWEDLCFARDTMQRLKSGDATPT